MVDPGVRADLAITSLFGGLCLANSGLGAVHGFAAALGARLGAPHGAVCARGAGPGRGGEPARRPSTGGPTALLRMTELAVLLTGAVDAEPEDVALWLGDLAAALQVPGLASYGLDDADTAEVVARRRNGPAACGATRSS